MKKILTIAGVLLANVVLGQVATLVKSYNMSVVAENIGGEGYYIWSVEKNTNKVSIYNPDHSLYKDVNTGVTGLPVLYHAYISKKLFNTDNNIEFLLQCYNNSASSYTLYIISETGQILQSIDNTGAYDIRNINGQATLIVNTISGTDFYNLQGNYTGLKPDPRIQSNTEIYPNPVETAATIKYKLPEGTNKGEIFLYAANGVLVKQMTITNQFENITIQRGDLAPGMYYYQIQAMGTQPIKQNFVIK